MPSPVPSPITDATATRRGLMGIVDQTFAGIKSFLSPIKLAMFPTVSLPPGEKGMLLVDDTTNRPMFYDGTGWFPVAIVTGGGGASLEAHIDSPTAHPSGNIQYSGGSTGWQDGTLYSPNNMDEAVLNIVEELAGPYGAAKIGTAAGGGLTGLNVQEQLDELYSDKVGETNLAEQTGASMVGVAPYGDLHFVTVEGQLQELDDEKMSIDALWDPNGGSSLLRGPAKTGTQYSLVLGTIKAQIEALLGFVNDAYSTVITRMRADASAAKVWGDITTGASPVVNANFNVSSVAYTSGESLQVNFSPPMANSNYHVSMDITASDAIPKLLDKSTNHFIIAGFRPVAGSYVTLTSGAIRISFAIFGNR